MGDTEFKTDEEYGYNISLTDDRKYPEGHNVFDFKPNDTEVTALQKIFDKYIDTSDLESVSKFAKYKLDFSMNVLDVICLILTEKIEETNTLYKELDDQLTDVSHRMTSSITGKSFSPEEKIKLFDLQEDLLNRRRDVKDTIVMMEILCENIKRSRNFIFGMNKRQYNAKSQRFRDDDDYSYGPKAPKPSPEKESAASVDVRTFGDRPSFMKQTHI